MHACNAHAGEKRVFTIDKLLSGSSLVGKELWTLRLSTSGEFAAQNPDLYIKAASTSGLVAKSSELKPTNKASTYV